ERAEELGLTVTDDEVWNSLANRYGMSSGEELKTQIGMIKTQVEQKIADPSVFNNFMVEFENEKPNLLYQKYLDLIMIGVNVTSKEAEFQQISNVQNANIEY